MKRLIGILFLISILLFGCETNMKEDLTTSSKEISYETYNSAKEYSENDGIVISGYVEKVYISQGDTQGSFIIKGDETSINAEYERQDFPNLHLNFDIGGTAEFKCVKKYGEWYLSEINNFEKANLDAGRYAEIRAKFDADGGGISKDEAIKLDSYCKEYEAAMTVEKVLENNIYVLYPELNN